MDIMELNNTSTTGLINALDTFATSKGWTTVYKDTNLDQIGLSKDHAHIAIGARLTAFGDQIEAPNYTQTVQRTTVTDRHLVGTVNYSLLASNRKYWGHPARTTPSAKANIYDNANKGAYSSYMLGPYTKVWLISNTAGDYVHIIVKLPSLGTTFRYSHFSFGFLENGTHTSPKIPYVAGCTMNIRETTSAFGNTAYTVNSLLGANNNIEFFKGGHFMTTFGVVNSHATATLDSQYENGITVFKPADVAPTYGLSTDTEGYGWLDYMSDLRSTADEFFIQPMEVTLQLSNDKLYRLGSFPGIYLCELGTRTLESELTIGSKPLRLFPIKQLGRRADTRTGATPKQAPNSGTYGFAYEV